MGKIRVGVCSEHKLLLEGICRLLDDLESIQVLLKETSVDGLLKSPALDQVHILILNPDVLDARILNLIVQMSVVHPKVMILILSMAANEATIHKTIKAGAKGFLARDSDQDDLLEAIFTLRNGHDYYSKSITQLLLKKYITDLKSDSPSPEQKELHSLSSRELEVLTLWGNSYTNNEISEKLFISIRTVESHKNHIMQKLNLKTAVDMVKFAIKNSIIEI
ncbi:MULTISPECIES: response regulator transcription factor [unclassified Oceanispirochaeta]|uniref:LuxR C-terminal-related transcriptional regulator n=1 Tax=unclassified Oceanispirochaeta TaxID=2635722 RepID=UPI000E099427|nr:MULTISPECIES: response regulator transcription factor [unclassified Oceanispirochaeta]MBF9015827.1 response regulator transcription factor [Oceanispirochaeta sp. M2]NPD72290.1 response regulator transcription factor [Oceanispirochaeta sp. M1]RDG32383.1 DNA-binding response regulator [Oceanispirochaeta sp. M1]